MALRLAQKNILGITKVHRFVPGQMVHKGSSLSLSPSFVRDGYLTCISTLTELDKIKGPEEVAGIYPSPPDPRI